MNSHTASTQVNSLLIFILALGAGFSVAAIYYAQPLLPLMGATLNLSVEGMGLIPTLTQVMHWAFYSYCRWATAMTAER